MTAKSPSELRYLVVVGRGITAAQYELAERDMAQMGLKPIILQMDELPTFPFVEGGYDEQHLSYIREGEEKLIPVGTVYGLVVTADDWPKPISPFNDSQKAEIFPNLVVCNIVHPNGWVETA